MVEKLKIEWFSNVRADILAGIVVALALIPEAIAFFTSLDNIYLTPIQCRKMQIK